MRQIHSRYIVFSLIYTEMWFHSRSLIRNDFRSCLLLERAFGFLSWGLTVYALLKLFLVHGKVSFVSRTSLYAICLFVFSFNCRGESLHVNGEKTTMKDEKSWRRYRFQWIFVGVHHSHNLLFIRCLRSTSWWC